MTSPQTTLPELSPDTVEAVLDTCTEYTRTLTHLAFETGATEIMRSAETASSAMRTSLVDTDASGFLAALARIAAIAVPAEINGQGGGDLHHGLTKLRPQLTAMLTALSLPVPVPASGADDNLAADEVLRSLTKALIAVRDRKRNGRVVVGDLDGPFEVAVVVLARAHGTDPGDAHDRVTQMLHQALDRAYGEQIPLPHRTDTVEGAEVQIAAVRALGTAARNGMVTVLPSSEPFRHLDNEPGER